MASCPMEKETVPRGPVPSPPDARVEDCAFNKSVNYAKAVVMNIFNIYQHLSARKYSIILSSSLYSLMSILLIYSKDYF